MKQEWEKWAEQELDDLRGNIRRLEKFMKTDRANVTQDHMTLMESQLSHMKMYAVVLHRRLNG